MFTKPFRGKRGPKFDVAPQKGSAQRTWKSTLHVFRQGFLNDVRHAPAEKNRPSFGFQVSCFAAALGPFWSEEHHVMIDLFRGRDGQLQGFTGPETGEEMGCASY